jgi:hypothetical protein
MAFDTLGVPVMLEVERTFSDASQTVVKKAKSLLDRDYRGLQQWDKTGIIIIIKWPK